MMVRMLVLALVTGGALCAPAVAQSYVQIPDSYEVTDITPDGSVVVGYGVDGGFYWRWKVDPAPIAIGGLKALAVSDDGSVIVGSIVDFALNDEVAGRWTEATGWMTLGYLPNAFACPSRSGAYDVSADGETVVGLSWDGCDGRGFRWTEATGMQELLPLANGNNRASAISGDGSAIGGFAQTTSRTPAYWSDSVSGAILGTNVFGQVNGFSEDGSLSVGSMSLTGLYNSAYIRDAATGIITELGALDPTEMAGSAQDITSDGATVVGYDHLLLSREAWVWTSSDGFMSLADRLAAVGVTGLPQLHACTAVSEDGKIVVGTGGSFFGEGFVADISTDSDTWVNVFGGTSGEAGIPLLGGSGSLVGGTPAGISLTQARESTLAVAWVSFNPTPLAALGGTVHTLPFNSQFIFNTSPAGTLALNTTWPVGVPPGSQIWFQFLIADSSSIHGIVLSNGLKATTP